MKFLFDLERGGFPGFLSGKASLTVPLPPGTPIGVVLYSARKLLGLSQELVSSQIKISQKKISRIERGENSDFDSICRLAKFYGLSLDEFVGECVE
jgi:DNA-binding XRE family transcriptional regulator